MRFTTIFDSEIPIKNITAEFEGDVLFVNQWFDYRDGKWYAGEVDFRWSNDPPHGELSAMVYGVLVDMVKNMAKPTERELGILNSTKVTL